MSSSSLPPPRTADETAALLSETVRRLRDQAAAVASPQEVWAVLVALTDVPGRLANVYDTLGLVLRRIDDREQLVRDDGVDGARNVALAIRAIGEVAAALHQARSATTEPAELVSPLKPRLGDPRGGWA